MYRMTARNIAVISPFRQNFPALSKAGGFAAGIIEKYSGTEAFPLNGEALVYFNALKNRLDEEKSLRDSIGCTIRLLIIHRLIAEGRLPDPTVTKQFLSFVSERVGRNMTYLRVNDSNAYTRITEAITYINKSDSFGENFITSEITENMRSYRYSSVDMTGLEQRFFGSRSDSYAYSGNYIYNTLSALVYRKEDITADAPATAPGSVYAQNLSKTDETVINAGNTDYSYSTENLTYKTENETSESTESVENTVSAPVTNITASNAEFTENSTFAPVANVTAESPELTEITEISPETVINTGDTNYSYSTENLTYKTENETAESTDIRNEQNVRNITEQQTTENTVSAPDANIISVSPDIIESTEIIPDNAVTESGTDQSYNTENLTYISESEAPENARIHGDANVPDTGAAPAGTPDIGGDGVPTLAETIAEVNRRDTEKAGDLGQIGLLVMNTFLSGGAEYMTSVKEKYVHKRIPLIPEARQPRYNTAIKPRDTAAVGLLNSPESAFGIISYAVGMLTSDRELSPGERAIYDSSVTKVYLEQYGRTSGDTKKMLAGMDAGERTRVLSLIVNRLAAEVRPGDEVHVITDGRTLPGDARAADRSQQITLRTVIKKIVDGLKKINFFGRTGRKEAPRKAEPQKPAHRRELPKKSVQTQSAPALPRKEITETETRLLRLLSGDSRGDTVTLIETVGADNTIASKLRTLYFGIPYVMPAEKLLTDRVEKAAYMPVLMEYTVLAPRNEYIRAFLRRISGGTNCYRSLDPDAGDKRGAASRETFTTVKEVPAVTAAGETMIPRETGALRETAAPGETMILLGSAVPRGTAIGREAAAPRELPLNMNSGMPTVITLNFAESGEPAHGYAAGDRYRYTVIPAYAPGGEEHILLRPMYSRGAVNDIIGMTAEYERTAEKAAARFGASALNGRSGKIPLTGSADVLTDGIPAIITLNYINRNNSLISGDNVRNEYTILPSGAAEPGCRIYLKPMYSRETVKSVTERVPVYERAAPAEKIYKLLLKSVYSRETVKNIIEKVSGYGKILEKTAGKYSAAAMSESLGRAVQRESAADVFRNITAVITHNHLKGAAEDNYSLLMKSIHSRDTVKNAIERLTGYRNAAGETEKKRERRPSGSRGTAERTPRKRSERPVNITNITNLTERTERADAGRGMPVGISAVNAGSGNIAPDSGITINSVYPEYELPVTVMSGSPVSGNVRLLPVYALDGVILPRKDREIRVNDGDRHRVPAPHIGRTVLDGEKPMTLYRGGRMVLKNTENEGMPGYNIVGKNETNVSMLSMMPETEPLRYREAETLPQYAQQSAAASSAVPQTIQPQLSQSDLEQRFGNLIEGADAGLTYSFDAGRRGISEAMATITQTAEKVALNSKLIEEIREKQLAIESETLKTSDMNKISDNTIRRLRGSLRLDRSRFS